MTVAAAAIVRGARFLAAQRRSGRYAGLWEFPGGKVEPGEDLVGAVHREIREELSVAITVGERVGDWWPLAGGARMAVFLATLEPGAEVLIGPDHAAMAWVGLDDFSHRPWIPADLPIVDAVVSRITAGSSSSGASCG